MWRKAAERPSAPVQRRTKASREAAKGGKPGNPGRFRGEPKDFLLSLMDDYLAIDKTPGVPGKNKHLGEFWHSVTAAFWTKFHWMEFDDGAEGGRTAVINEVEKVRSFEDVRAYNTDWSYRE